MTSIKKLLKKLTVISLAAVLSVGSVSTVFADTGTDSRDIQEAGIEAAENGSEVLNTEGEDPANEGDALYGPAEEAESDDKDQSVPAEGEAGADDKNQSGPAEDEAESDDKDQSGPADEAVDESDAMSEKTDGTEKTDKTDKTDKTESDDRTGEDSTDPSENNAETEEAVVEDEIQAVSVEYSFMVTGEDGIQYYLKFTEPDAEYRSAVLKYRSGDTESYSEGALISNYAMFSIPSGSVPVSVSVVTGDGSFDIDLAELEKESLKETVDGFLAEDEETARLFEDNTEEIIDESLVIESAEIAPNAIVDAIGEHIMDQNPVVMIDPGHGGGDPGAVWNWDGSAVYESHINLAISKLLQKELARYGITAYLTRDSDYKLDWEDRVKKGVEVGASLLVSVHIDTAGGKAPGANGVSILQAKIFDGSYNQSNAAAGQKAAKLIMNELVAIGFNQFPPIYIEEITDTIRYENGAPADSYRIIRWGQIYNIPSIIIEHGFIDNEHDYRTYLCDDKARSKPAAADAKAIAAYFGITSPVKETKGWHTDAFGRYYVTSAGKRYSGWKTIGNYTYYFSKDGYVTTGTPVIDGGKYWFDELGRRRTGWLDLGGMKLFFSRVSGKAYRNCKKLISGKNYLFNPDGVRYESGTPVVKNKIYHVVNGVLKSGWFTSSGNKMYFDPTTFAAVTGFNKISGKLYYFNSKGIMLKGGFKKLNGKRFYIDPDGVVCTGWKAINGKTFYFNPSQNGAAVTGWNTISKKRFFFNLNGVKRKGFCRTGKYTYFLYTKGGYIKSSTPVISGKKYCFDSKGHQVFGWYDLGGMKLYFDRNNGGAACTSTITLDGITYKFNSDGVLIAQSGDSVNAVDINGKTYTLEGTFITDPQIGTDVTEDEFFTSVVYAECGSEDYCAQVACAMVILNRMNTEGYPDSLPFVVYRKGDFAVARLEGSQTEPALTRYLKAFRDNNNSILRYIENANTMNAVKEAKKIMKAYKEKGTARTIKGIRLNNGSKDFACLYFMTPASFERLGLDYNKCNAVTYTTASTGASTVFFDKWVKA